MSKFKYRLELGAIEKYEIIKETEKTITYKPSALSSEQTERKQSNWQTWHDSFDDAKAALIERYESRIKLNEERLVSIERHSQGLKLRIEKAKNLKEV